MEHSQSPSVLFLALDTYSRIGGIQAFNQRIIACLATAAGELPLVHIMRDVQEDVKQRSSARIKAFGANRFGFICASVAAARRVQMLLVGHINLLPVAILCRLANPALRIVLFAHGDEVWADPTYRRKRFYEPLLLAAVDIIASVSDFTARRMAAAFGVSAQKFIIFPNAVSPSGFLRQSLGQTILCVARLGLHDRGKNIDAVIRAMALLPPDLGEHHLHIVGDGQLRPELEALVDVLGLHGRVRFLGRLSDAALTEAYRDAGLFVMPSSKEGFGIVYLEAWQHGLPVICGNEDAAHEIVEHGVDGFVVDPGDIALLADRIAYLLRHPEIALGMGACGQAKVQARYSAANFEANLAALLRVTR
jgi:phosphatidylinositol alpha-1,6-mannosyltransferase